MNRREGILRAALDIISVEGMRGLTYRAIAEKAGVPVSLPKYYFKTMEDLYIDAYNLFLELDSQHIKEIISGSNTILLQAKFRIDSNGNDLDNTIDKIAVMLVDYLEKMVVNERPFCQIEAAYMHEAIVNPIIRKPLGIRHQQYLDLSAEWFRGFGAAKPQIAAKIFLGLMNQLRRNCLVLPSEDFDKDELLESIQHLFIVLLNR